MRQRLTTAAELSGIALTTAAGFMRSAVAGVFVLGCWLFACGALMGRDE